MNKTLWNVFRLTIVFLVTASLAQASITGWLTCKHRDWDFVQKVGGVEVTTVKLGNGQPAVKVQFNPSGTQAITCKPVLMNSALVFDKALVRVSHGEVRVKVYTTRVEKGRVFPDAVIVPLPRKAHGNYRLRYENPDGSFFEMGALIVP